MKQRVVFIAKTNLNNDGRILNELRILRYCFTDTLYLEFILMPDKPLLIDVPEIDQLNVIKTYVRNNRFFRPFTVFEFTLRAFWMLLKAKPNIIHVQDASVALPVYLYTRMRGKNTKIIYDDHELPNENDPLQLKLFQWFESLLMRRSNFILFANEERQQYLRENSKIDLTNSSYLLNLPYFQDDVEKENLPLAVQAIKKVKDDFGLKFILHQGGLDSERGRYKLAEFSKILPNNIKIMIIGASKASFETFLKEFDIEVTKFQFVGSVPYHILSEYWKIADASIVMYLPNFLNNRLCAPNRLYISFKRGIPIIVNKDNPVLFNFIMQNDCGLFIEDLNPSNLMNIFNIRYSSSKTKQLEMTEVRKFKRIYDELLCG